MGKDIEILGAPRLRGRHLDYADASPPKDFYAFLNEGKGGYDTMSGRGAAMVERQNRVLRRIVRGVEPVSRRHV
jgi:hypothetical protein